MAVTLAEASKLIQDELRASVIEIFARTSPIFRWAVFRNVQGSAYKYVQEGELPGVAFRGVNGSYTESAGVLNPQLEPLKIVGGDADTDVALVRMGQGTEPQLRAEHLRMKVKAVRKLVERICFKGNSSTDPKAFDGWETRIPLTGSQLINQGSTDGGDTLTLAKLDELIDAVDMPTVLYMNRTLRRKVNTLMRAAGAAIETVDNNFGRQIPAYGGIPIETTDEDETGTEILRFNEVGAGGSTATAASIYCVSWGEDACTMLQNSAGLLVEDLGHRQEAPTMRHRIEWYIGQAVQHGRAVARLRGISNT